MSWRHHGHGRGRAGYHHGNLREALIEAALALIPESGPLGFTFAEAARQAGVSPAAPYHHFKDKTELLEAVAHEGWDLLDAALAKAKAEAPSPGEALNGLGVAYVCFARDNPALYRVMYDTARDREDLPDQMHEEGDSAYCKVRDTMVEAGADPEDTLDIELATTAAWCSAHGLAEMAGFKQFAHLKEACGGEVEFFRAIFQHMGLAPRAHHD